MLKSLDMKYIYISRFLEHKLFFFLLCLEKKFLDDLDMTHELLKRITDKKNVTFIFIGKISDNELYICTPLTMLQIIR